MSHYLSGVWNLQFLTPLILSISYLSPNCRLGRRFSLSSFMAFAGLALLLTEATDNKTAKVEYILLRLLPFFFTSKEWEPVLDSISGVQLNIYQIVK